MQTEMDEGQQQSMEVTLAKLLRAGVIISGFTVLLGGVLNLLRHGHEAVAYTTFRGEPTALRGFAGIVDAAMAAQGKGIIQLGLMLLVAVPVLRVAVSAVIFAQRRDFTYVVFTVIVLCILSYSLFFAAS